MHGVIHRLLRPGGVEVARRFRRARGFWEAFHKTHRTAEITVLAEGLSHAQHRYEALMEFDRQFAKETMAITCLGSLYDDRQGWLRGRADYAGRLIEAFRRSSTATEVKAGARLAAELYGINRP